MTHGCVTRLTRVYSKINYKLEPTAVFRGHTAPITAVLLNDDGDKCYTASADGTIRIAALVVSLCHLLMTRLGVWSVPEEGTDPTAPYEILEVQHIMSFSSHVRSCVAAADPVLARA